jgi:hypothetical protein
MHAKFHRFHFCFQVLCLFIHCLLHRTHLFCAMAGEADQTLLAAGDVAASDSKVASGAESDVPPTSSSSNDATCTMVKKAIPMLHDY